MTWTLDASTPTLDASSLYATLDGADLDAIIFTWSASYGNIRKTKIDLNKAQFGDGYAQRAGKGINNLARTWDLRFNAKSEATATAIKKFLEAHQDGVSFQWKPHSLNPTNEVIRVTCEEFDITDASYNSFDITATFTQVYGE